MNEKRAHPRSELSLECSFEWRGFPVTGRTLNLSVGGALVEAPLLPREGQGVRLNLSDVSESVSGEVVRSGWYTDGRRGLFGVRFADLSQHQLTRLQGVLP